MLVEIERGIRTLDEAIKSRPTGANFDVEAPNGDMGTTVPDVASVASPILGLPECPLGKRIGVLEGPPRHRMA